VASHIPRTQLHEVPLNPFCRGEGKGLVHKRVVRGSGVVVSRKRRRSWTCQHQKGIRERGGLARKVAYRRRAKDSHILIRQGGGEGWRGVACLMRGQGSGVIRLEVCHPVVDFYHVTHTAQSVYSACTMTGPKSTFSVALVVVTSLASPVPVVHTQQVPLVSKSDNPSFTPAMPIIMCSSLLKLTSRPTGKLARRCQNVGNPSRTAPNLGSRPLNLLRSIS
jgi:hypothetical protein